MENERTSTMPALDIPLELEALEPEDSPCQLICSIDKDSNMCFGCGRTPEEIADWPLRSEVGQETHIIRATRAHAALASESWRSAARVAVLINAAVPKVPQEQKIQVEQKTQAALRAPNRCLAIKQKRHRNPLDSCLSRNFP